MPSSASTARRKTRFLSTAAGRWDLDQRPIALPKAGVADEVKQRSPAVQAKKAAGQSSPTKLASAKQKRAAGTPRSATARGSPPAPELAAIDFCEAYIDAQRRYASADYDGDSVLEFAQRLKSADGKRDGLYWQPEADGVASPLGPFATSAEQYLQARKEGESFRGYYFRILKEQGANPPGGKYNYIINGNMIAGFGLIAWPADYRRSGIMTFQCGHDGRILEKDLGPETAKLALAITVYDPDKTWAPADCE